MQNEELKIYYFQVVDLWKRFCEKHNELLSLTQDEYAELLSSQLDNVEEITRQKSDVINEIKKLEQHRQEIIATLNGKVERPIESITELIALVSEIEIEKENRYLFKYNELLINIIESLQEQNKKNQIFINRALHSLRSIREEAMGEKKLSLYSSSGASKANI